MHYLLIAALIWCCSGCLDPSSDYFPKAGKVARIYTGFGLPRRDVLGFKTYEEAVSAMEYSKQIGGYSTEEWFNKLPPEDREKLTNADSVRYVERKMIEAGNWTWIPYGTRCIILEDELNGRGRSSSSPYKVKILDGPRAGEVWWIEDFQLDEYHDQSYTGSTPENSPIPEKSPDEEQAEEAPIASKEPEPPQRDSYEVVSLKMERGEENRSSQEFRWVMKIRNNTDYPYQGSGTLHWIDATSTIIKSEPIELISVPPHQVIELSGNGQFDLRTAETLLTVNADVLLSPNL